MCPVITYFSRHNLVYLWAWFIPYACSLCNSVCQIRRHFNTSQGFWHISCCWWDSHSSKQLELISLEWVAVLASASTLAGSIHKSPWFYYCGYKYVYEYICFILFSYWMKNIILSKVPNKSSVWTRPLVSFLQTGHLKKKSEGRHSS